MSTSCCVVASEVSVFCLEVSASSDVSGACSVGSASYDNSSGDLLGPKVRVPTFEIGTQIA